MGSPSLFPLLSNDELQNFCELLSCDQSISSPQAAEFSLSPFPHDVCPPHIHNTLNVLHTNIHAYNPPTSPLQHPNLLCSPSPHFSPNLTGSDHALTSSLLVGCTAPKRNWLSTLSSSSSPSTSSPTIRIPSSVSPLDNSYSIIASSHSLFTLTSSSTKNLQTSKTTLPLPSKLSHHELHRNADLSHIDNRQSKEASGEQWDGDDNLQPKAGCRGSMLGANAAFGVVLHLSDVKAALQAKPFESHLSNSANASLRSPHTSAASGKQCDDDDNSQPKARGSMLGATEFGVVLRYSDVKAALQQAKPFESQYRSNSPNASLSSPTSTSYPSNSTNPHTFAASGMDLTTTDPSLMTSCNLTSTENVDEWLQYRSCTNEQLTRPNVVSKWCESKKNKELGKLESVPRKVIHQATMLNGVMQNTRQAHESQADQLARMKYNNRNRRRDMKDLYGSLKSLLPDGDIKVSRGSVLIGTMEYIKSLVKELDELDKQKVEVIRSMEKINIEPNAKINATKPSHIAKNYNFLEASIITHAKLKSHSRTFVTSYHSREIDQTHVVAKARTCEGSKSHAKAKVSEKEYVNENRVEGRVTKKRERSHNSSDEHHRVKVDVDGKKLDNLNNIRCVDEKIDDVSIDCFTMNGDESALESQGTREDVGVRFFGEDAFINLYTSKRKGVWSSLLQALEEFGIYICNVSLSSGLDFNHHRIHAKVSSSCELNSSDLQERLIAFIS